MVPAGVVTEVRLPLSWSITPARGSGQVTLREGAARAATGRLTGQGRFDWGVSPRVEAEVLSLVEMILGIYQTFGFEQVALDERFEEFLTIPAYERLD